MSKVVNFFYEVLFELKKVKWPTGKELLVYGWMVFWIVLFAALILGLMDVCFGQLVQFFIDW